MKYDNKHKLMLSAYRALNKAIQHETANLAAGLADSFARESDSYDFDEAELRAAISSMQNALDSISDVLESIDAI